MSQRPRNDQPGVLAAYLVEVNATPLLSAEQERELAGRIAVGDLPRVIGVLEDKLKETVGWSEGERQVEEMHETLDAEHLADKAAG
jgi:hypothetical protein